MKKKKLGKGKGLGEIWDPSRRDMFPMTLQPDRVMLVSHAHRPGHCLPVLD